MRQVIATDKQGMSKVWLVRDNDPDSAATRGIPIGPPDLLAIDCQEVLRELNNRLVAEKILTWKDIQENSTAVSGAVRAVLVGRIVALYKQQEARNG